MSRPPTASTPTADKPPTIQPATAPLNRAPVGAVVRLAEARVDQSTALALRAMGLHLEESVRIQQAGEPTIVSVSGGERRIGLAKRVAQQIIVTLGA